MRNRRKGLRRTPWSRRQAITLFDKLGFEHPSETYRKLRTRWASDASLPAELKVHLVLGGAVCEWLEQLSQLQLILCVQRQRLIDENCDIQRTLSSTIPILATDAGALLNLCRLGYDVQARSLLRNLIEKIDLLICLRLDGSFAAKYLAAQSLEDSRDFFYKNVTGGKLSKKALRLFEQFYPSANFVYEWLMVEWRQATSLMLGSAAHPNHAVSMISLFPNLGRGRSNAIGLGGHPTNGSNLTISKMIYACMPMYFLFSDFPYEEASGYAEDVGLDVPKVQYHKNFFSLLLHFPLVDSWLQDLESAKREHQSLNNF